VQAEQQGAGLRIQGSIRTGNTTDTLLGIPKQLDALLARPGSRSLKRRGNIAERGEPIERGIHPAIQRNIRRAFVLRWPRFVSVNQGSERIPGRSAKFRTMMRPVNILGDQPTKAAADKSIGRKVLPASQAEETDGTGKPVREDLCHRAGIFMRQDSGSCPGCGRVFGGEGIAALEKVAPTVSLQRALATGGEFQALGDD